MVGNIDKIFKIICFKQIHSHTKRNKITPIQCYNVTQMVYYGTLYTKKDYLLNLLKNHTSLLIFPDVKNSNFYSNNFETIVKIMK